MNGACSWHFSKKRWPPLELHKIVNKSEEEQKSKLVIIIHKKLPEHVIASFRDFVYSNWVTQQ